MKTVNEAEGESVAHVVYQPNLLSCIYSLTYINMNARMHMCLSLRKIRVTQMKRERSIHSVRCAREYNVWLLKTSKCILLYRYRMRVS